MRFRQVHKTARGGFFDHVKDDFSAARQGLRERLAAKDQEVSLI